MEKPSLQIKRHYAELSEKETDEAVNAFADMVVNYIKSQRKKQEKPDDK